jgi:hypothetical protein
MCLVYLGWKHARHYARLFLQNLLEREASESECRPPTYLATFQFFANEPLSGNRKNRPNHVFPGGSSHQHQGQMSDTATSAHAQRMYSELSLPQQSFQVSPEPTIHLEEQEDTSEDEDEERSLL